MKMKKTFLASLAFAVVALVLLPAASWANTDTCTTATSGSISVTWCYDATTNISGGAGFITLDSVYLNGDQTNVGDTKVVALDGPGTISSIDTTPTGAFTAGNPDCDSSPFNGAPFHDCWGATTGKGFNGKVASPYDINVSGLTVDSTLAFHFLSFANNTSCSVKVDSVIGAATGTFLTAPVIADCGGTSTPEPGTLGLLGMGLAGMVMLIRRKLCR